jgi:hypothetical protein
VPDPATRYSRLLCPGSRWHGSIAEHNFRGFRTATGTPGRVRLLSQSGTGASYTRPITTGRYVRLPLGLWEQGWIVHLSEAALALLIVLLDMQSGRADAQWIAPAQARRRCNLSPDTWMKGIHERCGILKLWRMQIRPLPCRLR